MEPTERADAFAPGLPADPDQRKPHNEFPIVGIGASAGGLEAIRQLLGAVRPESGISFIVVQHLDPHHPSRLTELLARSTTMPVFEATHGQLVAPNTVYVIPPNTSLAIAEGALHLKARGAGPALHLPIDYLFRSLAAEQLGRAIGVILSGTGADGTQGVCELKAVGGITFAQEVSSAAHSGMPSSAIESGCIDFVFAPEGIAARLHEIVGHPYLADGAAVAAIEPPALESYHRILAAVRSRVGVDFSHYRDTTIKRRIMRRMALHGESSVSAYADHVKSDKAEALALYHDLLIHVTSFFRDPEVFETLKQTAYPEIARGKAPNEPVRVWVPGCSSGQEAYSIAMTLVEFYDNQPIRPPIQVFATDLSDQAALDRARAGVYPEGIELEVTPERLRRFFRREDHMYRIDRAIRDMCVFARHNVTSDPPFSNLDLISCRNVLIYLSTPLQKKVLPTFHYSLRVPGFLILGTAETVGENTELFDTVDRNHRIYSKKGGAIRQNLYFPAPDFLPGHPLRTRHQATGPVAQDFQREADRILLGRYAPPGVLVDENFEVLQFRGRTGMFLETPPGEPTTNVLKMAREGLFLELRNALTEARKTSSAQHRDAIRMRTTNGFVDIGLEIAPVTLAGGAACFLVLFHEASSELPPVDVPKDATPASASESARETIQLRQELAATREYLQSMLEQQDAANEELRSANEEVLSSNEELQSTNEELETAKEELQSTNEELTTVNEQLQRRNIELDESNNDLLNLLSSTNMPVVMVGADRRIRRFTSPAKKVLNLLPTDIGRPIGDMKPAINVPDLELIIEDVIDRVQPYQREVKDRDGHWHMLRVYPYQTTDNRIEGAVVLLVDIDQMHLVQENLRRQAALIELSKDAIVVRDAQDHITFWNQGAEAMYGWKSDEALGRRIDELLQTNPEAWAALKASLERTGSWEGELVQRHRSGRAIQVDCREVLVRGDDGKRTAVLAIKRDVTRLRHTIHALQEADRRKDEFLATLAHELRNPLAPIRNAVEIMRLADGDKAVLERSRMVLDRQAGQLARMVEDLIDMARIAERKIELRLETCRLSTIVDSAIESCEPVIERNGQRLTVSMPDEPLYVEADPVRVTQILINLLNNASKYSDEDTEIQLIVERAPATAAMEESGATDAVVMRVRDQGQGIARDLLPHVFDMFTQGPRSTQQGRGGLGIGLALVRSLTELHGGTVAVHSDGLGKGCEFSVLLPLTDDEPEERRKVPRRSRRAVTRRILVVDDNDDQVLSLAMLLELQGHTVAHATSGQEALESAAEFKPEIALVDLGMPDMSGFEVAQQMRDIPGLRNVVLVAQTGWGGEEDRKRSAEAGFDIHLVKPVTVAALDEVVRTAKR